MIRPLARQKGLTEKGTMYVLTQWAPNSIQLTLQSGDYVMSETLENLQSESEMIERRDALENEFIIWMNTPKETPNETAKPLLLSAGSTDQSGEGLGTPSSESV